MLVSKPILRLFILCVLISWIAACSPTGQTVISPIPQPTVTASPSPIPTSVPTLAITPDTGWQFIQPGVERRLIHIYNEQAQWVESLYLFRLDQNQYRFDVAYHETPQSLEAWQAETNAFIVLNGGYFRVENEKQIPNGLTIVGGQAIGNSYESFAGMLAIGDQGAELRWLAEKPYDPDESLLAAVQSFPVLVKPGGVPGFDESHEDNIQARRTAIAQDKNGNILLILAPRGYFTLHQLSRYLTESDLNLDIAINLDGGPSSGILVTSPPEVIPSLTALPLVILAYAK